MMETNAIKNIHIVDPDGLETWIEQNEQEQITHYKTSDGYEYFYEYDERGNKIREYYPESGLEILRTYDDANNMLSRKHVINDNIDYQESYEYNDKGLLTKKVVNNDFEEEYSYDENNRLVSIVDSLGNATQYAYDENGSILYEMSGPINQMVSAMPLTTDEENVMPTTLEDSDVKLKTYEYEYYKE